MVHDAVETGLMVIADCIGHGLIFAEEDCGLMCSGETAAQNSVEGTLANGVIHVIAPQALDGVKVWVIWMVWKVKEEVLITLF
jgi:hypothetical protein